jgi:hypothetical protein
MFNSQNTQQAHSETVNAFALFESRDTVCPLYPANWYVQEWSDPREVSYMLNDILKEKKANDISEKRFCEEIAKRINHAKLCHFKVTRNMLNTLLMGRKTGQEQDSGLAALMYAVVCIVYGEKLAEDWSNKVG